MSRVASQEKMISKRYAPIKENGQCSLSFCGIKQGITHKTDQVCHQSITLVKAVVEGVVQGWRSRQEGSRVVDGVYRRPGSCIRS